MSRISARKPEHSGTDRNEHRRCLRHQLPDSYRSRGSVAAALRRSLRSGRSAQRARARAITTCCSSIRSRATSLTYGERATAHRPVAPRGGTCQVPVFFSANLDKSEARYRTYSAGGGNRSDNGTKYWHQGSSSTRFMRRTTSRRHPCEPHSCSYAARSSGAISDLTASNPRT